LVSMKSPNFCQKAKFQSPCQSFQVRIFFTNNHTFSSIFTKRAPMFLKCDPYRIWCSIFYSKLVNCILLRSLFVFVKGRGTCGSGERNVKIWIDFRKSPRFSLTSPLSQEREKSSRPVFTMCGEPWLFCPVLQLVLRLLQLKYVSSTRTLWNISEKKTEQKI
jgi:hypothetical protein